MGKRACYTHKTVSAITSTKLVGPKSPGNIIGDNILSSSNLDSTSQMVNKISDVPGNLMSSTLVKVDHSRQNI